VLSVLRARAGQTAAASGVGCCAISYYKDKQADGM